MLVTLFNIPGFNSLVRAETVGPITYDGVSFTCEIEDGRCEITKVEAPDEIEDIYIPERYLGHQVDGICDYVEFPSQMKRVYLPGSIRTIASCSFLSCENLREVYFEEGCQELYIKEYAFCDCPNLESITLPSSLITINIKEDAFYECNNLTIIAPCDYSNGLMYLYFNGRVQGVTTTHNGCGIWQDASTYVCSNTDEELEIPYSAQAVGHSLTLDGKIGVNFGTSMSDDLLNAVGANSEPYAVITLPNEETQTVNKSDWTYDQTNNCYVFTAYVAAKEMADNVSVQIFLPLTDSITWGSDVFTYSVASYWNTLQASYGKEYQPAHFDELQDLVAAMLYYGGNAQNYFEYKTSNTVFDVLQDSTFSDYVDSFTDLTSDSGDFSATNIDICIFDSFNSSSGTDVSFAGVDLVLDSTTTLGLYLKINDSSISVSDLTVTVDGDTCPVTEESGYAYIAISNICATDLDYEYDVQVSVNGHEEANFEFSYCPLAYHGLAIRNRTNSKLLQLVASLEMYNFYAHEYFDSLRG